MQLVESIHEQKHDVSTKQSATYTDMYNYYTKLDGSAKGENCGQWAWRAGMSEPIKRWWTIQNIILAFLERKVPSSTLNSLSIYLRESLKVLYTVEPSKWEHLSERVQTEPRWKAGKVSHSKNPCGNLVLWASLKDWIFFLISKMRSSRVLWLVKSS